MSYDIKELNNNNVMELSAAKHLLYKIYVEEQSWIPKEDNPSNLKIIKRTNGKHELSDEFDKCAKWFGVFEDEKIIAVHRITEPIEGKLEMQRYFNLPQEFLKGKYAEFSRLAILKEHRCNSGILLKILGSEFKYLFEQEYTHIFTTAAIPNPANLYAKLGLKYLSIEPVRYNNDENDVAVLFQNLQSEECHIAYKRLQLLLKKFDTLEKNEIRR